MNWGKSTVVKHLFSAFQLLVVFCIALYLPWFFLKNALHKKDSKKEENNISQLTLANTLKKEESHTRDKNSNSLVKVSQQS